MIDNFQSKPVVKPPKDAKTVRIKSAKDDEVVLPAEVHAEARKFLKELRQARSKQ